MLDGLPRVVFVGVPGPFHIERRDACAEALANDFPRLIDVLAGRRVEGARRCALCPCPPASAATAARRSCLHVSVDALFLVASARVRQKKPWYGSVESPFPSGLIEGPLKGRHAHLPNQVSADTCEHAQIIASSLGCNTQPQNSTSYLPGSFETADVTGVLKTPLLMVLSVVEIFAS